jgi:hypothetical protein
MKSLETYIQEARSNPDLNPKTPINDIIQRYHDKAKYISGTNIKNAFASFTEIDKLGTNLNPSYKTTPLGIYAYLTDYIIEEIGKENPMNYLPYAGGSDYVNLFQVKGNILVLQKLNQSELQQYYLKLGKFFSHALGAKDGSQEWKTAVDILEEYINDAPRMANVNHSGGRLWYVTKQIAKFLSTKREHKEKRYLFIWNKIFREIGIDAVLDEGDGIIHSNEPTQIVVFNPRAIKNKERHYNKYSPKDVLLSQRKGQESASMLELMKNDPFGFINDVNDDFMITSLPKNHKNYKIFFDRVINNNVPSSFLPMTGTFINELLIYDRVKQTDLVIYMYERILKASSKVSSILLQRIEINLTYEQLISKPKIFEKIYSLIPSPTKKLKHIEYLLYELMLPKPKFIFNKEIINFVIKEGRLLHIDKSTISEVLYNMEKYNPKYFHMIENSTFEELRKYFELSKEVDFKKFIIDHQL